MPITFKTFDIEPQSNIDYARSCAAMLAMIVSQKPRMQCITNTVAMGFYLGYIPGRGCPTIFEDGDWRDS